MKILLICILATTWVLGQDPQAYYYTHLSDMARRYRLHLKPEDKDHPVRIRSVKEADSLLTRAELFAATVPDSMYLTTKASWIDSFYKNPYKIKYIRDHHLVTTHKRFYGNAIDSLK